MSARRPGLWVEIALALALLTLATILLNAGMFWLLLKETEEQRRTDLALALSEALSAQLEVEAVQGDRGPGYRRVLGAYESASLDVSELYVVDTSLQTVAALAGQAPEVADSGLRAALFGRTQHVSLDGVLWGRRSVVVTTPVAPRGHVVAALRVRMPLKAFVPGGPAVFVLAYSAFSGGAIALFGFSLFRRRLLGPVAALQRGTHRIAAGEFGHRVTVDAARELQELCGALNTMSASLAAYRSRTAEQLDRLERANRDLSQAQEALVRSERLAGVGRLAAGLAHEVGNPLSAVLGYVELLEQGLDDPAVERDLVDRARRELERIHGIIRQLLDYARQGAGEAVPVDLGAAVHEAVATVQHQPVLQDLTLEVRVPAELPRVHIEPDKLHQVLVNLLLNAADAVQEVPTPRVWLRARAQAGEGGAPGVALHCEDNGPGFDAVALDQALEPFFTTKDVGEGTGLGLSTCQQVMRSAGGSIRIGNRAEGGADVALWLPRSDRAAAAGEGGAGG